jgi:hypothetical protein
MFSSAKFTRTRQGIEIKANALAIAMKRKEEYLGARVPKELKQKVIARASELRIPVSILIRNVLEEAFGGKGLEKEINSSRVGAYIKKDSSGTASANKFPMVLGWEDIRLNRSTVCTGCGKSLEPGSYVTLGIAAPGEERILLCDICKESL